MRRRTRPRSDVSTYLARIDSPLQRLVRERAHPRIRRSPQARRQITWVAGDGHRGGRRRGGIRGRKCAVRARRGLIGPTDRNDANIHVHAGGPGNGGRLRARRRIAHTE